MKATAFYIRERFDPNQKVFYFYDPMIGLFYNPYLKKLDKTTYYPYNERVRVKGFLVNNVR